MNNPGDAIRHVINYLAEWAKAEPKGCRTGGAGPDQYAFIQLHHRPDPRGPESQLTFRALLVDGRPVIQVQLPEPASSRAQQKRQEPDVEGRETAVFGGTGFLSREPEGVCEGCGVTGTVGRAVRTDGKGQVTEIHRFCLDCWPEHAARYRARWEEEGRRERDAFLRGTAGSAPASGRSAAFEAATWHETLHLVRELEGMLCPPVPPTSSDLAQIALQIQQFAPKMEGEMPFEVSSFVQRYGPSTG